MSGLRDFIDQARDGGASVSPGESADTARNYDKKTNTFAERKCCRWTDEEVETVMNPELTTKQAALKLGRTLESVWRKRKRVRDAKAN